MTINRVLEAIRNRKIKFLLENNLYYPASINGLKTIMV